MEPHWPALPAPRQAFDALDQCAEGRPVLASEDRGLGVAFLLFGTPTESGFCYVKTRDGAWDESAGGMFSQAAFPLDDFYVTGWDTVLSTQIMSGVAPVGTAVVRVVADGRVVEATLAGRHFLASWPKEVGRPTLLVAFDANGRELARREGLGLQHVG